MIRLENHVSRKNPFWLRTKHVENVFVFGCLALTTVLTHGGWKDWLAVAAVYFTFKHAQIADRMREQEDLRPIPSIECPEWLDRFFVLKEMCWIAFFVVSGSYPALAGCFLFLAYPVWRRFFRKHWPLPIPEKKEVASPV